MIVLDASVLIAHFDASDAHHARAERLLSNLTGGALGASPITLAEVLVGPVRAGRGEQAMEALQRLGMETCDLPDDASMRLATLRSETGLRLPDCCVVLAAEESSATVATFDDRLADAAAARGLTVAQS